MEALEIGTHAANVGGGGAVNRAILLQQQHIEDDEEDKQDASNSIEREDTMETNNREELQNFVDKVNSIKVGEGTALLELVYSLPKVNSIVGQGHTKTRILKYLDVKSLLPKSLVGKYHIEMLFII